MEDLTQVRVLIADDHEEMLEGIRDLLEPEFDVVGAVRDGSALLAAATILAPDVIVADISMPHLNGIDAAEEIIRRDPSAKIILLTVHNDPALVRLGLSVGVLGYVLKMKASRDLPEAIHEVLRGNRFISPLVEV